MSAALIAQRRTQMVVHSYLYYVLDQPIVSDATWQRWADELVQLQAAHPGPVNVMDPDFADWTGDTGMHLPRGGSVHAHALHLLKLHQDQQLRAGHQAPIAPAPEPALEQPAAAVDVGQLVVGRIVSTNYNTGPFVIREVSGPCTCPEYLASLGRNAPPSEPHYHLTVEDANPPPGKRDNRAWLNGYRLDGTNVWSRDRLIFGDLVRGTQQDLFGF
jgi:hypothetical protein